MSPLAASLSTTESVAVIIGVIVGGLGLLFTLVTLAGGNYRAVKSARIVADYKSGYDAIQAKAEGQEEQIQELKRENAHKDEEIAALQQELSDLQGRMSVLQEYVTGRSAIEALTAQLAGLAEVLNSKVGEVLGQVGELRAEVHSAHGEIITAVRGHEP